MGEGVVTDTPSQFAYTFEVASYYKDHPLIIDPTLVYSTYLGGSADDFGSDIAVDAAGNAYIMGWASSANFPATLGAYDTTHNGGYWDEFIVKLDTSGSSLVYATYLGGNGYDYGSGIAVDASGNVYITGQTSSSDFPTTVGPYDTTYNGSRDVFVAKLDAAGSALSYSTYLGGSGDDVAMGISVDASGNAYVAGYTNSSNFQTTPGTYDTTFNGGVDGFVVKLDASGSVLSDSTYIGTSSDDFGANIALENSRNAYVIGRTLSTNFPTTSGVYDTTLNGGSDVFVMKFGFPIPAG